MAVYSYIVYSVLHLFCFALATTVCALYGLEYHHGDRVDDYSGAKWLYAIVVGAMSAVTCLVYFVPFVLGVASLIAVVWDFILFVLWIVLFGVFGKIYIHVSPEGNGHVQRMKNAVWVDLASALLWLIATVATAAYWWQHREMRSRFTGRARV